MVDLGSGLFARLFENKVRNVALSTPLLVKSYVESRSPASPGRSSSRCAKSRAC